MNGEIYISDIGDCVKAEILGAGEVQIQIGQSPIIIMNRQQAYNLAKAMRVIFPQNIAINESGFCVLEGI